jgi:hypothetical protein
MLILNTLRRRSRQRALVTAVTLALGLAIYVSVETRSETVVPYPEAYREWVHVKSALMGPEHADFERSGGFTHTYANDKAIIGYRTGTFPEGSMLVVDWLETRQAAGMYLEGARRRVDMMVKDKRFSETGGWGFERFKGDSKTERMVTDSKSTCFTCHNSRKTNDLVLSTFRQ